MDVFTLLALAAGLSMDAFAVAVCKGLALRELTMEKAVKVGLWFGCFQALMSAVGYGLGIRFRDSMAAIDHWIALVLLGLIGINMIKEACWGEAEERNDSLAVREMLALAVATSIDALAAGISLAFLSVNILWAVAFIGVTTFFLSMAGVKAGSVFGTRYKVGAELVGGILLIGMGVKIFLQDMGILR
ncbi:MAG: manganese efflux pump MntP family protein [Lachnospiraceae bacterium]|nr:manganese efflux pump MntP family protein [Lachnospiraceae bacterium]